LNVSFDQRKQYNENLKRIQSDIKVLEMANSSSGRVSYSSCAQLVHDNEFQVMLLEPRPFRPFKTSEEYLYAMKEDLAEWLNTLYGLKINVDNFMNQLETGVVLCRFIMFYFFCHNNILLSLAHWYSVLFVIAHYSDSPTIVC